LGWVPSDPFSATGAQFNYSVIDNVTPNIFLQNDLVSSGTQDHKAISEIWSGNNVTTSIPQGNYVVNGTANVILRAGNRIMMKTGTVASPSQGGSFHASIEPFFTCTQYPSGREEGSGGRNENGITEQQNFIKEYEVSFKKNKKDVVLTEKLTLNIYPNPVKESVTFEYYLPKVNQVTISIIDAKGIGLVTLKNRDLHEAGTYRINTVLNNYPKGIYIVTVKTEVSVVTSQLIKQ